MSLKWNVPLKNGKDVFFTEESFNIFNNFISFEERLLQRLEEHDTKTSKGVDCFPINISKVLEVKQESASSTQMKKEAVVKQASYKKLSADDKKPSRFSSKEDEAQSSLKLALHITKGRLPPPRKSSLCHEDQKMYLSLFSKYGCHPPADPTEEEITELNKLKMLQIVVKREQEEFHKYALSLAKALQAEYHYMDAAARKYMEARLSAKHQEVELYPSQYNVVSSFTLKGTGQASQLNYIKPLLHLGSVPKMIIPTVTYDRRHQLSVDAAAVRQENPIRSDKKMESTWNHEACSLDQNAEILAVQHRGHIVISPGALMCLVDNFTPDYSREWELPFSVKEYDVIEDEKKVRHRIVYIDKPFPSKVTERAKNTKFYKFLLRHIFCPHHSKDQTTENSLCVDTSSWKTEDKKSVGEEKGSTEKKFPLSHLGDIFDIGKSSMEDVETFGTSSFESFTKRKKNEIKSTNVSTVSKTETSSHEICEKKHLVDNVKKVSRKVDQGSLDIFSDPTTEDIETFGLGISEGKSTISKKGRNKETGQGIEDKSIIEDSVSSKTRSTSSTSSDVHLTQSSQTASSPVSQVSTLVTQLSSTPVTLTPPTLVAKSTESTSVLGAYRQSYSLSSDTLGLSTDTMETQTESHVTLETTTESHVTMEIRTNSNITIETQTECPLSSEKQVNTHVSMEAEDCHISEKMTVRNNECQVVKDEPFTLIPIDLPDTYKSQSILVNPVTVNTDSNLNTNEKEHEIIMDAPASPVSMDTPASPNFCDSISSPSENPFGPKVIPMSAERHDPQSFCSPDVQRCVIIPLEIEEERCEEVVLDKSQVISQEGDNKEITASPVLAQRRSRRRRYTNVSVSSDLDSDDEKLLIDVSSLDESAGEEVDVRPTRRHQAINSKSQLKNIEDGKTNSPLQRMESFQAKSAEEDSSRLTRVTRSRQSQDIVMTQMKQPSSGVKKEQKKGDKMSERTSKTQGNNSNNDNGNTLDRHLRSRTLSESNLTSSEVRSGEKNPGIISPDKALSTVSKTNSLIPENDSNSSSSLDVSIVEDKGQSLKVTRRSSRLSAGSSPSKSEVKNTEGAKNTSSKVLTSDTGTNDEKIKEVVALPVTRKRGRPKKTMSSPPSNSPGEQDESRHQHDPTDSEPPNNGEDSVSNPVPLKKKRGRPPKQKVEAPEKTVETTNTGSTKNETDSIQTEDMDMDNSSVIRNSSSQIGSKVKASMARSSVNMSAAEEHVSRVKPRLVATMIPKTEQPINKKQTTTATKTSGPKTAAKKSTAEVSTFDSILQGMQDMLHTPGQKVTDNQCQSQESNTSTFKQPDSHSNVSYHLWSLGGFQVVVRCGYHGTIRDDVQKLSKVHICTKMEYQSSEGLEQTTASEMCRSWISGYIRPHCKLLRARIDPLKSELIALEEISLNQLVGSQQTFR
ncbi:uncharacterized protein LOC132565206 isoform X2 [Ylistrum balloti]|nr:uncharacterized protein LOC132565206 isoform X2 [Ylistrum balloti]